MAMSAACSTVSSALSFEPLRRTQSLKSASTSRVACCNLVRAAQVRSSPPSSEVESGPLKVDVEIAAFKVFTDDSKGIVCYRNESGELICEGMDEGPQFYPPCGANFYMPGTRAAAILPLLGEVMYEI